MKKKIILRWCKDIFINKASAIYMNLLFVTDTQMKTHMQDRKQRQTINENIKTVQNE